MDTISPVQEKTTVRNPLIIQLWSEGGYNNLEHPEIVFGQNARGSSQLCRRGINIFLNGAPLCDPSIFSYITTYIRKSNELFMQDGKDIYTEIMFDVYHLNDKDREYVRTISVNIQSWGYLPPVKLYTISCADECANVFFNGRGEACDKCERFNPAGGIINQINAIAQQLRCISDELTAVGADIARTLADLDKK